MKTNRIWVAFVATVLCASCDNTAGDFKAIEPEPDITSIEYHELGGMLGFSEKLTVTPDSIHYTYYIMTTTGGNIRKELHEATPVELWRRLQDNCNFSVFSKIEDGESWRPMDGTDVLYTVKTSTGEHTVTNGQGDNYRQLSGFFELVLEQVALCQEKAVLLENPEPPEPPKPPEYPELEGDITSIDYHHFGSMMMLSEKLTITPDSIHYTYSIGSHTFIEDYIRTELHVATPEELWSRLQENCDLSVFSKIEDGKSLLPVDGTDVMFTVKTSTGGRVVINGQGNNYEQLSGFFELILEQVALCQEKATPSEIPKLPESPEYPELDGDVNSINYHRLGGIFGLSEKWTVTPDSVHYVYYSMTTTGGDYRMELHVATPERLWSRLLDNCNLSVFSKIEDGISWVSIDGIDIVFTVKTSMGERAVTNGQGDNYEQLSGFFELILEQVARYREKARP